MKPIGKITHYYDKIGVAIIELSGVLKVGDKIKIEGGKNEFDQTVEEMQVDHKPVETAKAGDAVGIKVKEKIREGALVLKLEE
ncbi:MAG: EF-Tu/IF-2/RF-3 family GTPase [Minisyncoccia bacterium]